jgi:hypothetical protein
MFLHIGGDDYIFKDDIVVILDRKTVNSSKDTSRLIEKMIKDGLLKNQKIDDAKTYIITCKKGRKRSKKQYYLYMSNISSSTLLYRNNRW